MSSKRFIVFGNPPTVQQLRTCSISPDKPTWKTRIIHYNTCPAQPTSEHTTQQANSQLRQSSDRERGLASNSSIVPPNDAPAPADHSREHSRNTATSSDSLDQTLGSRTRPSLAPDGVDTEDVSKNSSGNCLDVAATNSDSIDYYQSQLDYRDSFEEVSGDISLTPTPGNRTSCLFSHTQPDPNDPSPPSAANRKTPQSQASYSESMIVNLPQWHFDARSCTSLDQLKKDPGTLYSILFYLSDKKPLGTIELKKPRKDGSPSANIAHFECMDDSGSSLKLTLWDEVAESLDGACLIGDIVFLSGIAISTYQGKPQASSTFGTRAQICYRLRPTHTSHLQMYCPDMRLAYDPTTRRVGQLVEWAKSAFF